MPKNRSITLGVIVGNRNFFPDALVAEGRREVLEVLAECNIEPVILDEQSTKLGGLETWRDAKKCAALFDEQRHWINGILVVLPKRASETIKLSGLNVPIHTMQGIAFEFAGRATSGSPCVAIMVHPPGDQSVRLETDREAGRTFALKRPFNLEGWLEAISARTPVMPIADGFGGLIADFDTFQLRQ